MFFPSDLIHWTWYGSLCTDLQVVISKSSCTSVPDDCFYLGKQCRHPDEMLHYAAFHLGLHCFHKVSVFCFPVMVYKGLILCLTNKSKKKKQKKQSILTIQN